MTDMTTTPLRDLVEGRLARRWSDWAGDHPHLAEAIDRTRLVESTVARLVDDPDLLEAIESADLNAHQLDTAARIIHRADYLVRLALA